MKAEKIGTENSVDAEGSQKYKEWVVAALAPCERTSVAVATRQSVSS